MSIDRIESSADDIVDQVNNDDLEQAADEEQTAQEAPVSISWLGAHLFDTSSNNSSMLTSQFS